MNDDKLTQQFFEGVGLNGLSEEEKQQFKLGFLQTVYDNVNVRLLDQMTEDQIAKMNQLVEAGDNKAIDEYQRSIFSNYDQIVGEEFAALKNEVKQSQADEATSTSGNDNESDQQYATVLSQPLYDSSQIKQPPAPPKLSKSKGEA